MDSLAVGWNVLRPAMGSLCCLLRRRGSLFRIPEFCLASMLRFVHKALSGACVNLPTKALNHALVFMS